MKKNFLIFSTLVLMAITAFNINLSSNRTDLFDMTMTTLESKAYQEEVTVTCSVNDSGPCWIWKYDTGSTTKGSCSYTGTPANTCIKPK